MGRWAIVDPDVAPGQGAINSAQRVAAVGRRFAPPGRRDALEGRAVLLVDDLVVTGWTLTLAARAIRAAGAAAVLPLALGRQRLRRRGHVTAPTRLKSRLVSVSF